MLLAARNLRNSVALCAMNRRFAGLIGCLLLLTLATGCATKYEGGFNPAFFPRVALAPEARQGGRVALWVRPHAKDFVYSVTRDKPWICWCPSGASLKRRH